MKKFFARHKAGFEKIEHLNLKLIPFAIIALLIIIIIELFVHIENHTVELSLKILDGIVITIFIIDLFFLALKAKTTSFFFKNYWLDILAVFPFGLMFNTVERFYRGIIAAERIVIGQAVAHETLEIQKEVSAISKSRRAARFMRIIARSLRLITKSRLFTHFHHRRRKAHKKLYR